MEERLRFVARRLDGEGMSDLCREFGISRKTGYKIFNGHKEYGLEALCDRSRRPVRYANQLPEAIEQMKPCPKTCRISWTPVFCCCSNSAHSWGGPGATPWQGRATLI